MRIDRHAKAVLEHLIGPNISIILHILIVFLLVRYVAFDTAPPASEITVEMQEIQETDLDELEQFLDDLVDLPTIEEAVTPPDVPLDMEAPDVAPTDDLDLIDELTTALAVDEIESSLVMRGLWADRSGAGRQDALTRHGGALAVETERAVLRALRWLKENQNEDGTWSRGTAFRSSYTGLGLLTYLAHGETTSSEEYGETIERAIRALLALQADDGMFGHRTADRGIYEHGIATYAISEAFGLTRIPTLKPAMEKAVQIILDGQQTGGGWDYRFTRGARRDTSAGAWMLQALKAAEMAGAENEGIQEAMRRGARDIKSAQNRDAGWFGYTTDGDRRIGTTPAAVLCLQLLGHGRDRETLEALAFLQGTRVDWRGSGGYSLYTWLYITQAMFHHGGSLWQQWNELFAPEFVKVQNTDGSWPPTGISGTDPEERSREQTYGPVYTTTLAALALQVYYRFLPTFQPQAVETPPERRDDDITIEII